MKVDKIEIATRLNHGILDERFYSFKKNILKNQNLIDHFGGLSAIISQLSKKHVIIIGAGPSLENSLNLIKKYQQRNDLIIISTDMALKSLLSCHIVPHFVFTCETKPVDFFSGIDTHNLHLISFSGASASNLAKWQGDISFYNWMIYDSPYDELWDLAGVSLGYLGTGSVITTQAFAFSAGCDVKTIMLVGNDLGYKDHYYALGSLKHKSNNIVLNRFKPFETLEFNTCRNNREYEIKRGNEIYYTNKQFLAAKYWLEELAAKCNMPLFDSSIPGCSGKYFQKVSLKNYFDSIFTQRTGKKKKSKR